MLLLILPFQIFLPTELFDQSLLYLSLLGTGKALLKPAAHGEESAQQSGMNVVLLRKILAVCG